jgi:hypothetical protein
MIDYGKKIRRLQRRKIIYIVIASFLIVLNLLVDLMSLQKGEFYKNYNDPGPGTSIGYFIGSHIFILFALLLFYRVFKIGKRIEFLNQQQLNDTVDAVGSGVVKE